MGTCPHLGQALGLLSKLKAAAMASSAELQVIFPRISRNETGPVEEISQSEIFRQTQFKNLHCYSKRKQFSEFNDTLEVIDRK